MTIKSAKTFIKQKVNKVLIFTKEVFGTEELTNIAKPYVAISSTLT